MRYDTIFERKFHQKRLSQLESDMHAEVRSPFGLNWNLDLEFTAACMHIFKHYIG